MDTNIEMPISLKLESAGDVNTVTNEVREAANDDDATEDSTNDDGTDDNPGLTKVCVTRA